LFGTDSQAITVSAASVQPYTASAVHFDGANTVLINDDLVSADTPYMLMAVWLKQTTAQQGKNILAVDPVEQYNNSWGINSDPNPVPSAFAASFANDAGSIQAQYDMPVAVGTNAWAFNLVGVDLNHSAGNKLVDSYHNNTNEPTTIFNDGAALTIAYAGLPIYIGDDSFGFGFTGDMADLQVWQLAASPLVAGALPLATRRLFIDANGKPVNPTTAIAVLGTPCICLSGNASSFASNTLGAGGAFTPTGLTNASTSPSD
jgi:hypothetical protein